MADWSRESPAAASRARNPDWSLSMALISTDCQPAGDGSQSVAAGYSASGPLAEGQGFYPGLGQMDEYGVVNTYPGMPGSDSSSWWKDLISGAVKTVEGIATAKTQTKGVLTQTSPGVFTYVQPEGSSTTLPVGTGTFGLSPASSGMGMYLVAGAAVLVLFMMMRRK